ncbi:polyprenyl synthetase family protein [Streptomyces sp. BB1-1-1]|uniref:polyprenyl synthetase family protein n=1 Tax=Streptomyces sp. BB1-1-1 TaxID=3074430 RepID=UPI00287801B0|nr:polyprenyl synthetase family protein [Streptomyces sp. BB1-1-1]WND33518.1 polyprenyl synthetase family protein [Streptomyces sp. BB1-1-1]
MPVQDSLIQRDGVEPLGQLVADELERRWAGGAGALDAICYYSLVPAGKLFRPILLLDSAQAVGGDPVAVLPAAAGAECGHVASLIHDDIIDQDDLRRGRPSVQSKYGINDAIVAGDALIFDLFASLAECRRTGVPDSRVARALGAVAHAGLDLCRGQSLEAELTASRRFDAATYIQVAILKTAAFFRGACESGAILGGGSSEQVAALRLYGETIGTAFQIHDDLLAYLSNSEVTGKPDISDVQNGRVTLPVILAHEAGTPDQRRQLTDALFRSSDAEQALRVVTRIARNTGAITAATHMARTYAETAKNAVLTLPPSPSRERLTFFADAVINRDC